MDPDKLEEAEKETTSAMKKDGEIVCRICLSPDEEDSVDNPLFQPCQCAGTMKYIHVDCIKEWLHGKIHTKDGVYTNSFNWKYLECELCKVRFKDNYIVRKKVHHILNYDRPTDGCYITLESFTNTPHKTIHVVHVDPQEAKRGDIELKVGRGNDVDIRITDISVSRVHAIITLTKGEFMLTDHGAKFGTLLLLRDPVPLGKNSSQSMIA